jgi:hypothetical protein
MLSIVRAAAVALVLAAVMVVTTGAPAQAFSIPGGGSYAVKIFCKNFPWMCGTQKPNWA